VTVCVVPEPPQLLDVENVYVTVPVEVKLPITPFSTAVSYTEVPRETELPKGIEIPSDVNRAVETNGERTVNDSQEPLVEI
jgi:hypothetical protein